jgi:hypothetical protein
MQDLEKMPIMGIGAEGVAPAFVGARTARAAYAGDRAVERPAGSTGARGDA